ncbi:MAG: hypothetical protein ACLGIO_12970, partial [Acidimicrobiia bacterium]
SEEPEPGGGWTASTDPRLGWRFEHPAAWTVQRYSLRCRIGASGTVVTNLGRPLHFQLSARGCTTSWDLADAPGDFVAVALGHLAGGRAFLPGEGPDTTFPLSLPGLASAPGRTGLGGQATMSVPVTVIPVTLGGDSRYSVRVWFGPDATAADRRAAARLVGSIRPGGPARTAPVEPALVAAHVPEGFRLAEDIEVQGRDPGDGVRILTWVGGEGDPPTSFQVRRRVGTPPDPAAVLRSEPGAEAATVQGRQAVLVRHGGGLTLSWAPHPDVTLSVSSADVGEADLRGVAEGLRYRPELDDLGRPASSRGSPP